MTRKSGWKDRVAERRALGGHIGFNAYDFQENVFDDGRTMESMTRGATNLPVMDLRENI